MISTRREFGTWPMHPVLDIGSARKAMRPNLAMESKFMRGIVLDGPAARARRQIRGADLEAASRLFKISRVGRGIEISHRAQFPGRDFGGGQGIRNPLVSVKAGPGANSTCSVHPVSAMVPVLRMTVPFGWACGPGLIARSWCRGCHGCHGSGGEISAAARDTPFT